MDYWGFNASTSTFVVVLVGYTMQIALLYKSKSTEQLSLLLFLLITYTSISWAAYGFSKKNWYIFSCNIFATLMLVVIVCQIIFYRFF